MSSSSKSDKSGLVELARRMRSGFQAFCASIDLYAFRSLIKSNPREALHRVNDLQRGFADALVSFPGGSDYRVCFAGDSVFVVKELQPEEKIEDLWPTFCGHIYGISSFLNEIDTNIGNKGIRVIISYGKLIQLFKPDSWKHQLFAPFTENWFVLTGASEAFKKTIKADVLGKAGGFLNKYCWHELPNKSCLYQGTPIEKVPLEWTLQPKLYPRFYERMNSKADLTAQLNATSQK